MEFLDDQEVWSDSDGVVYDFEGGFYQRFDRKWEDTPAHIAWPLIYKTPDFYEHLPLFPWAKEYWERLQKFRPGVLSGAPTAGFQAAAEAKRRAWKRDFDEDRVVVCFSKDKVKHMKRPGDILIDDKTKMIQRWEEYGGTGILFTDLEQTFADLRAKTEIHVEQVDIDVMEANLIVSPK